MSPLRTRMGILLGLSLWAFLSSADVVVKNQKFDEKNLWKQLPSKKQLQRLPEYQVHQTPELMLNAGKALGSLAQHLEDHPTQREQGFEFYKKCSSHKEFPNSIRAVCWRRAQVLSQQLFKKKWEPKQAPEEELQRLIQAL